MKIDWCIYIQLKIVHHKVESAAQHTNNAIMINYIFESVGKTEEHNYMQMINDFELEEGIYV